MMLQPQPRCGQSLHEGVDRHLAIDESRQIDRQLESRCRVSGSLWPRNDLRAHEVSSVFSLFQMNPMNAMKDATEISQMIVAMTSMAGSMPPGRMPSRVGSHMGRAPGV